MIKTLIKIDIHLILMPCIFLLFIFNFRMNFSKLYKYRLPLYTTSFFLVILVFLSLILFHNYEAFRSLVEFILITIFFFMGVKFNRYDLKVFYTLIISISLIESFMIFINRDYIYQWETNYLLVTMIIGVSSCLLLILILHFRSIFLKLFFIFCYFLTIIGIISMQARATALFVLFFSFLYPIFYFKRIKKGIYLLFLGIVFFISFDFIFDVYQNAKIYERMTELIYDFENEPRLLIYKKYFFGMQGMWLTGFGMGQSSNALFGDNDYPHNFILEFGSEFGILGILFIVLLLGHIIFEKKYVVEENKLYFLFSYVFFLYFLVMFFKSFSIYDSYLLFLSFGFMWSFIDYRKIGGSNYE